MKKNLSPENTTKVISRVAASAASTWDMTIESASTLVAAALSDWADSTSENHYRPVMTTAMAHLDPHLSSYVLDDIVGFVENETRAIATAERFGL